MKSRRDFVTCGACACCGLLCVPRALAQGLIICKSCGREAKAGETVCSRCETPLPQPRKETPAQEAEGAPQVDVSAEVQKMAAAVIEANYRAAQEAEKAGQVIIALPYYQNAMALMRLLPPGRFPKEVSDALLAGRVRALREVMAGQVKCKPCNGTGKYQLDQRKVDPTAAVRATGVSCQVCKGKGWAPGMADVPQAKAALLQGRGEFERRQMLAGEVRLGRAFVPAEMEAMLRNPQRALVMTGMQIPCDACQGTARQPCTTCRGTRWVKCTYTGCKNGEVPVQTKPGEIATKRLNEANATKCPKCLGQGEIICQQCEGNASVDCQKCSGSGTAPRCARCSGTGLQECTKCKGTGRAKDAPCVECGGDGVILCTTCRGEGARAK